MSRSIAFQETIALDARRCVNCNKWFASEPGYRVWICGSCMLSKSDSKNDVIDKLTRSNAALRGALKRRAR